MDRSGDLGAQLMQAVRRTDERLFARFMGRGGTTLVACLFFGEKLWFACVGDSFLYLSREGALVRLNAEQNQQHLRYAEAIARGELDPSPANEMEDAARLSEFMGSGNIGEMDATRRPLALQEGDALILCSDGVGDVLPAEELGACLAVPDPMQVCAQIDTRIRARALPAQDNYTALVIRCGY